MQLIYLLFASSTFCVLSQSSLMRDKKNSNMREKKSGLGGVK